MNKPYGMKYLTKKICNTMTDEIYILVPVIQLKK